MKTLYAMTMAGALLLCMAAGQAAEPEHPAAVIKEAAKVVPAGKPESVDRIEIRIGNEVITTTEIELPLQQLGDYLKKSLQGDELKEKLRLAREQHIKKLIESKLLLLEARRQKIDVQEAMVKETAGKEIEKLKAQFPSEEAFRKQLAMEHLNETELLKEREKMARENIMRQKLLQEKLREFRTGSEVDETQLKEYYEKNKEEFHSPARAEVHQIFIPHPSTALGRDAFLKQDHDAKLKIEKALQELKQGRPFAVVAKAYSEHRLSAEQGGSIGWIEAGVSGLPEFEKAVFNKVPVGGTSGILDTSRGYFIVQVADRQAGKTLPLEEVKGRIRQDIMNQGSEKRFEAWIDSLKQRYPVVYAEKR